MKLTAAFLFGAALLASFISANYDYGSKWQVDYPQASLDYQISHGITPTEYQHMLDDSVRYLGLTLTNAFDYEYEPWVLSHLLQAEATKHKARMDELDDMLTWLGYAPGPYADFLYQQMCLMDFAVVQACSAFNWTHDPLWDRDAQTKYFAGLLVDSLSAWAVVFSTDDTEFREYLFGIGYDVPEFEMFMRPWIRGFAIWWIDVLNDYDSGRGK